MTSFKFLSSLLRAAGKGSTKTNPLRRFVWSRKTGDFLRFARCASDPAEIRGVKHWGLFTISAVRARDPLSAEIRVAEVKKLRGSAWSMCKNLIFFDSEHARARARIVRVEALSLWRRANLLLAKWSLEVVARFARLLSESRGRGVDPRLVRGSFSRQKSHLLSANVVCSSGWRIATFKYNCSTRSTRTLGNDS